MTVTVTNLLVLYIKKSSTLFLTRKKVLNFKNSIFYNFLKLDISFLSQIQLIIVIVCRIYLNQFEATIYNMNWMDCTMLKKMRPMPHSKSQLFWLLFRTLALFWLLITISTDHYQYLSDPSFRQLQFFLLLRMPGLSKIVENLPHFLRSVAIRTVHPVYIIHRWFEDNAKSL